MAEIITKDSDEFKELAGWINRAAKAVEDEVYGYAEAKVNGEAVAAAIAVLEEVYETLERY